MVRGPNGEDIRIGAVLRAQRDSLALSQEAVGHAIGVSQAQVGKYETGENRVPLDKIRSICEFLQIDANFLFGVAIAGAITPVALQCARDIDAISDRVLQQKVIQIIRVMAKPPFVERSAI